MIWTIESIPAIAPFGPVYIDPMLSPDGPRPADRPASVAAVITSFNPGVALVAVCASVIDQVDLVVVVDDGTPEVDESVLEQCRSLGAVVERHGSNRGIGAALNTGVSIVRRRSTDWSRSAVLTLDQDSTVPAGYVDSLLRALDRATVAGVEVGTVGPAQVTDIRASAARSRGGVVFSREPIQSGLLVPASTLDTIGPFDSGLFIDGVDTEYYLRCRSLGLHAIVAPDAALNHQLGQRHNVTVAGRRLALVYAATFRYYYIARNRVALVRRYGRSEPRWAAGSILKDLRHLAIVTALVPGRRARIAATTAGLKDGARSRSGRRGAHGL